MADVSQKESGKTGGVLHAFIHICAQYPDDAAYMEEYNRGKEYGIRLKNKLEEFKKKKYPQR